jgi:hypothetical protein
MLWLRHEYVGNTLTRRWTLFGREIPNPRRQRQIRKRFKRDCEHAQQWAIDHANDPPLDPNDPEVRKLLQGWLAANQGINQANLPS